MSLDPDEYKVVLRDHDVYTDLLNAFRESSEYYRSIWEYDKRMFYAQFRSYLKNKCKCHNDGSCFLYFKTAQDYIWFRLKYG